MPLKIVLIDDDPRMNDLYEIYLKKMGIEYRIISCVRTFLKKVDIAYYDLIITDWMMPFMNGVELCKLLKKMNIGVPVILCSSMIPKADRKRALEYADEVVEKPIDMEFLKYCIDRYSNYSHE